MGDCRSTGCVERHGRLHGLCDRKTHTIFITRRLVGESLRQTLLHEMCHVAARRERANHGPQFRAELGRLAERGETWADIERQRYADPTQLITGRNSEVRQSIEDTIVGATEIPTWAQTRLFWAHWFAMSPREFSSRYPWAKATFQRALKERLEEDERQRRFQDAFAGTGGGSRR